MSNTAQEKIATTAKSIDTQLPLLAYLGFGAWVGWNLLAFSGNAWLEGTDYYARVSDLFVMHLSACVVTLVILIVIARRATALIARWFFPFVGGGIAMVGTALIVLARPSLFASLYVFALGCLCAGVGTTLLFVRSCALFGALKPRTSFIRLCAALLFGCAIYCTARMAPDEISLGIFLVLPLVSAFLFAIRPYDKPEHVVLEMEPHFTKQFISFLAAIIVFATAAQVLKNGVYPLAPLEALVCYDYMVVLLMLTCTILAVGVAASSKPFGFARIYEPATLAIIALLVIVPLVNMSITVQVALSSAANYVFNLMVWGMLSYIVFQAQGNALRVFSAGNAALAAGSIIGVALTNGLRILGIGDENFMMVCLVLALVAIIASLFIFPEHKMAELLLPIDEAQFEPNEQDVDPFAPWKAACHDLSVNAGLTEREEEVFTMFARGKTTQQVADALVISPYTVRAHTRNIYAKLDIHSRSELSDLVESRVNAPNDQPANAPHAQVD